MTRKTGLVWLMVAIFSMAGALIAMGRAQAAETLGFSAVDDGSDRQSVTVVDESTMSRIDDAQIVQNPALHSITVSRTGYAGVTLIGAAASKITVYLKKLPLEARAIQAKGTMSGWQMGDSRDDNVHAGLVMKAMNSFDLVHFQFDSLISPLKDDLNVFGHHKIPSNLVLPEQDIFLLLGSITINKSDYRLPLVSGQDVRLVGVQGQMSVDEIVPAFQGGSMSLTLLNHLQMTKFNLTESIHLPGQDFERVVDASQPMAPTHTVTVSAPPFTADVLVAAVTDLNGDREVLFPTDLKLGLNSQDQSGPRAVTLSAPTSAGLHDVVSFAVAPHGKRLSAIFSATPGKTVRPGAFLPVSELADGPALPATVQIQAPAQGVGMAIFESEAPWSTAELPQSMPSWYVVTFPSAGAVEVETARVPTTMAFKSYSVVQLDFGAGFNEKNLDGRVILKSLSRFTRATA
ncbi:MAG: hypothetical protein ACXWP5_05165, partial [Bdellovibrionota bacterium]